MIINSYTDTLLEQWCHWNSVFLTSKLESNADSINEILGESGSSNGTRALEMFRIGLLKGELSKKKAFNDLRNDTNLQSNLGFISALIYKKYNSNPDNANIKKAFSGLNAIYSVIQSENIAGIGPISINTIIFRLLKRFPKNDSSINIIVWIRYILSAFYCELFFPENSGEYKRNLKEFIINDNNTISLRIIDNKTFNIRAILNNSQDVKDAIKNSVSLTHIIKEKAALFAVGSGSNNELNSPKGFWSIAYSDFKEFLESCYNLEINNINDSPFESIYGDDLNCKISTALEELNKIRTIDNSYKDNFDKVMKSIKQGSIEALDLQIPAFTNKCSQTNETSTYMKFLTAIRTKPFLLIAGISGTGKSRIVRKLAQATVTEELQKLYDADYSGTDFNKDRWSLHSPANFELIQVKPNWHNSMDIVGYLSNIPQPHYVSTTFIDFIAKAWLHPDIPFFLCLDEMNLAPVEEYFAEFLSAIESRSFENKEFVTDPIIKPFEKFGKVKNERGITIDIGKQMIEDILDKPCKLILDKLDNNSSLYKKLNQRRIDIDTWFTQKGLTLPKNLIVIGTVNMDETTFSFSRKVLDRAMSIEMNEINYDDFLSGKTEDEIPVLEHLNDKLVNRHIYAKETLNPIDNSDAEKVIVYLKRINNLLDNTPYKLGYRTANEALLYIDAAKIFEYNDINKAIDEFTLMKILSRIEGDESKLKIEKSDTRIIDSELNVGDVTLNGTITILTCLRQIIKDTIGEYYNYKSVNEDSSSEELSSDDENSNITDVSETQNNLEIQEEPTTDDQIVNPTKGGKFESIKKIDFMIDQLKRDHFVSYWN